MSDTFEVPSTVAEPTPQPRKPIALIVVAVVLLLAAGTFGTLWVLEKNSHSTTTSQLGEANEKQKAFDSKLDTEKNKYDDLNAEFKKAKAVTEANTLCLSAAKQMVIALEEDDDKKGEQAVKDIIVNCRDRSES